ncbi:hypothetical protein B9K06_23385 [Bacillus sp. OG2]|nr:hypothetical protein B9K06_23385 [Bacillus sp. OG2]
MLKKAAGIAAVFFAEKRVNKDLQALLWADFDQAECGDGVFQQVTACPFSESKAGVQHHFAEHRIR